MEGERVEELEGERDLEPEVDWVGELKGEWVKELEGDQTSGVHISIYVPAIIWNLGLPCAF